MLSAAGTGGSIGIGHSIARVINMLGRQQSIPLGGKVGSFHVANDNWSQSEAHVHHATTSVVGPS